MEVRHKPGVGGGSRLEVGNALLFELDDNDLLYLSLRAVCLFSFGSRVCPGKSRLLDALQSCSATMSHGSFVCSSVLRWWVSLSCV